MACDAPELKRYRGWVALISKPAGETKVLDQYVFPASAERNRSLSRAHRCGVRSSQWHPSLKPVGRAATGAPLVDDEAPPDTDDEAASEWNRAAWFGWQFMSLRDAKP